jgi:nucleotide-binding universal stress UspA family protein
MTSLQIDRQQPSWIFTAPDKILVGTDLTDLDYLVPYAIAQAEACGASLVLAHVIPSVALVPVDAAAVLAADAAAILDEACSKIRAAGVRCEAEIRHGSPVDVVAELVGQVHAGRVVLGTHGRRNLKRFFLGSTANEILKKVEVPAWTVGPHARPLAHGAPHRILHPVSLSSGYQETAKFALGLAQLYKAEITLLHVLPRDVEARSVSEHLVQWTAFELGRLIPQEAPLWTTATIMVEAGEVVDRILEMAEKMLADLIVMGSNPDSPFWPVYGDNTVYNVIAEAKCPVLTLRHSLRVENKPETAFKPTIAWA